MAGESSVGRSTIALGYLMLPHVQMQERADKMAHPGQVQERDPADVREETEVIR